MLYAFLGHRLRHEEWDVAACIATAWGGLLRAKEALNLCYADVAMPGDARLGDCDAGVAGVLVRSAKTGRRQVSLITDPLSVALLVRHCRQRGAPQNHRMFNLSYSKLLGAMGQNRSRYGLDRSLFTTHSCRHGSALTFFSSGTPTATTATRGRWASLRTLERYLRNGPASVMETSFTRSIERKSNSDEAHLRATIPL